MNFKGQLKSEKLFNIRRNILKLQNQRHVKMYMVTLVSDRKIIARQRIKSVAQLVGMTTYIGSPNTYPGYELEIMEIK